MKQSFSLSKSPFTTPVDRWRVKTSGGYLFDRRIFIGLAVVVVLFALYGFARYDFDFSQRVYLHCPPETSGYCANPLFGECEEWYCQMETLSPGTTIGEKPDGFFTAFPFFVGVLCVIALVLNHALYNRKYEGVEL